MHRTVSRERVNITAQTDTETYGICRVTDTNFSFKPSGRSINWTVRLYMISTLSRKLGSLTDDDIAYLHNFGPGRDYERLNHIPLITNL